MAEPRAEGAPLAPEPGGLAPERPVFLSWVRERWALLAGLAVLLLVVWLASGEPQLENGRYALVKDDIPCRLTIGGGGGERRWCYLIFDTRTGELEERVREIKRR